MKKIEIYTSPTCHFCHAAKDFFNNNSIEYTEIDVASNPEAGQKLVEKTGQLGVPVIFIDDEFVVGFDEPRLKELLNL